MATFWKEPDMGVPAGEQQSCAAARMWRSACGMLCAPDADDAWKQIVGSTSSYEIWHTVRNCTAYQAGVWQGLVHAGVSAVVQPAAFKLAMVLRHTPSAVAARLLVDLLRQHPQKDDVTSYVLSLLTDDEASESYYKPGSESPSPPPGPAPLRDLLLFGDCELAVLAAGKDEYDAHAKLVRAEYPDMTQASYVKLRIKVLNQFLKIPKLYRTPEFEPREELARENIKRELASLRADGAAH